MFENTTRYWKGEIGLIEKRNQNVDLIRTIACIAVVGLHTYGRKVELPNSVVYYLCGFAVPFFFMASGYFLLNRGKIEIRYSLRKIVGIVKTVVVWNLIYGILKAVKDIIIDNETMDSIFQIPLQCVKSLVLKGYFWHFWFLGALMLIYFALPSISKLTNKIKRILLFALGLFCVLMECFSFVKGSPIQKNIVQTFRLWTWMFYFVLGGEMNSVKCRIKKKFSTKIHGLVLGIYTVLLVLWQSYAGASIIIESTGNLHAEYFYDSIFEIFWITLGFTFILRLNISRKIGECLEALSSIVMGVYIIHPFVVGSLAKFIAGNSFIETSFLFISSLVCSSIIARVMQRIPSLRWLISL